MVILMIDVDAKLYMMSSSVFWIIKSYKTKWLARNICIDILKLRCWV